MNLVLFLGFLFSSFSASDEQQVIINVNDLKSDKGNIQLTVFLDQENFETSNPYILKVFPKNQYMGDDGFSCELYLPSGTYGICLLDDENSDGDINYNFLGVPKEGYGFSGFLHTGFSRPVFSDFDFVLKNEAKIFDIEMRYF